MKRSLNLSPVSYRAWLRLVFDHPLAPNADEEPPGQLTQWYWNESFHTSNPARLVQHFARLCRSWNDCTAPYTLRQVDQGVWFLLSEPINFGELLADLEIPLESRVDCVRAMLRPYADFLAGSHVEEMENCFEMWWHLLCHRFWSAHLERLKSSEIEALDRRLDGEVDPDLDRRLEAYYSGSSPDRDLEELAAELGLQPEDFEWEYVPVEICYAELEDSEKRVPDAMFETLRAILTLDDSRCQSYALRGFGHLKHPGGVNVVQRFIDQHRDEWDTGTLAWVESCRDGTVM
jgi:hypothetical protein